METRTPLRIRTEHVLVGIALLCTALLVWMVILCKPYFPDPEAAKANFRACLAALNSPECYAAFENSGFPVYVRREDSTPEEAVAFAEQVFRLKEEENHD